MEVIKLSQFLNSSRLSNKKKIFERFKQHLVHSIRERKKFPAEMQQYISSTEEFDRNLLE